MKVFNPDFEINDNIENYAFGIYKGIGLEYDKAELQTIKTIVEKYNISEDEVYRLFNFVKSELPAIRHKDLSKDEIKGIEKFIESNKSIKGISFIGSNGKQSFRIEDKDLINVLLKYVRRRYNFADSEGDKSFKKHVAKTLYKRLIEKIEPITNNSKDIKYNSQIIIGLIFAQYHIALINEPILTELEHVKAYPSDNYLNYLERKIRSFLTD